MRPRRTVLVLAGATVAAAAVLAPLGSGAAAGSTATPQQAWGTLRSAPASELVTLNGVASTAADDAVAVGSLGDNVHGRFTRPYAEHWDGSTWSATSVPSPQYYTSQHTALAAVSSAGRNDAWAVGAVVNFAGSGSVTLAYHWNGSTWTRVATPNPSGVGGYNQLTDVAARGPNDVWAVGATDNAKNSSLLTSVVLHWNGTTWSRFAVPDVDNLVSVTVDKNAVWVSAIKTVLRIDASGVTRLPEPTDVDKFGQGGHVTALASSGGELWAVGVASSGELGSNGYAAYWDGTAWHPQRNNYNSYYSDVTAVPGGVEATTGYQVYRLTTSSATEEITPPRTKGPLNGITADATGRQWAVGDSASIIDAPGIGQGGITVTAHRFSASVTWLGPQRYTLETDETGYTQAGGLPAGTYTVIAASPYCTPGVQRVTVTAGQTSQVDVPVTCPN